MNVLVIDVGGTHVKVLVTGQKNHREFVSGRTLTPILGGGNVRKLKKLPPRCRAGDNANAFKGGFRLWEPAPAPRAPQTETHEHARKTHP